MMSLTLHTATSRWSLRSALLAAAGILLAAIWFFPPLYVALGLATLFAVALTLRWPMVGFCLLIFSVPWGSGFALQFGPFPISPTDILVASLVGAWLVSATYEHRNPIATAVWTPYIFIFVIAIALSATQAADAHASIREIVKWSEMGLVYLAGAWFLRTREDVRLLIAAVVAAGVTQAMLGYIQFAFHLGPEAFAVHRLFLRAYGTFEQPNPYAGYLNTALLPAFAMALVAPGRRERFWYGVASVLMLGAILASESRGALLAALVAAVVVSSLVWRQFRALTWSGILAVAACGLLANYGLIPVGPFMKVLTAVGVAGVTFNHLTLANFSSVERAAHWLAGVRMFAAHPLLGVGIGNYAVAYPAYHPRAWYAPLEHAHNYYINIAAEAGVVGLAAYLLLVGSALWYSYAAMRRARYGLYRAATLGVLGALVAITFHNLFDVLYVHGMAPLLGVLMAVVPASLRQDQAAVRETPRATRVRATIGI